MAQETGYPLGSSRTTKLIDTLPKRLDGFLYGPAVTTAGEFEALYAEFGARVRDRGKWRLPGAQAAAFHVLQGPVPSPRTLQTQLLLALRSLGSLRDPVGQAQAMLLLLLNFNLHKPGPLPPLPGFALRLAALERWRWYKQCDLLAVCARLPVTPDGQYSLAPYHGNDPQYSAQWLLPLHFAREIGVSGERPGAFRPGDVLLPALRLSERNWALPVKPMALYDPRLPKLKKCSASRNGEWEFYLFSAGDLREPGGLNPLAVGQTRVAARQTAAVLYRKLPPPQAGEELLPALCAGLKITRDEAEGLLNLSGEALSALKPPEVAGVYRAALVRYAVAKVDLPRRKRRSRRSSQPVFRVE